jgi:putative nucleotidyltransferase with HDIG domain
MPLLRVQSPGRPERSFAFARRALLGRDPAVDLQLDDPSVSAYHAVLHLDDAGVLCVTDLRSSNGTHLNGERIARAVMDEGMVLSVGSCRLELLETDQSELRPGDLPPGLETADEFGDEDTAPWSLNGTPPPQDIGRLKAAWGELAALYELGEVLHLGQREEHLYRAVAELVARSTGAQRVSLVNYDQARSRAHTLYTWPDGTDFSGGKPYSHSIIEQVIMRGRTILVPDVSLSSDLRHAPSIAVNAIRSALCAPMQGREGVIGMILATHHEGGFEFQEQQIRLLTAVGQTVGTALENHRLFWRQERSFLGTLEALVQALDARDPYTAGHSLRVTELSLSLARWYPLEEPLLRPLRLGALLHDVGKIGVEDACLRAARSLTEQEFDQIRRHPALGSRILEPLEELDEVKTIVCHHHERWDGSGYPDGLVGERIPLAARIIAVADTIDAITSDRPYRRGNTLEHALAEVRRGSGTQFDPGVVRALERAVAAGELAELARLRKQTTSGG